MPFIVLEGPDGAGKTTQARRLVQELQRRGREPLLVREPGGTPIGDRIRAILLDPVHDTMDARTELFLYMASRAQLCRDVILPNLRAGKIVVADRFLASSAVYQGIAGGIGIKEALQIGTLATQGVTPDLTVVLDLDAEKAAERIARGRVADRIERKDLKYHRQVCEGYRWYVKHAKEAKDPIKQIDATRDEDLVFADVLLAVEGAVDLEPTAI